MADQNESHHHEDAPAAASDGDHTPEVVDGEVAESTTAEPAGITLTPDEAEKFRQYQQFLEFQKFQQWQRQQGDGNSGPSAGPRPWWRRVLGLLWAALFRRVLSVLLTVFVTLLVVVLAIVWVLNHFFGGHNDQQSSEHPVPGNQNPALSPVQGINPKDAVSAVYKYIAYGDPAQACEGWSAKGQADFAAANSAPTCVAAAQQLHGQVTNLNAYVSVVIPDSAVTITNQQAVVNACGVQVGGGPRLGTFLLQEQPNRGWDVDGYQSPPARCPGPPSSAPPS